MAHSTGTPTVLLVEDEPDQHTIMQWIWERIDVAAGLVIRESLERAREFLTKHDGPLMVITDAHLPDGQGTDLLDMLPPGTRGLVLSSQMPPRSGDHEWVQKQGDVRKTEAWLRGAVEEWLQQRTIKA